MTGADFATKWGITIESKPVATNPLWTGATVEGMTHWEVTLRREDNRKMRFVMTYGAAFDGPTIEHAVRAVANDSALAHYAIDVEHFARLVPTLDRANLAATYRECKRLRTQVRKMLGMRGFRELLSEVTYVEVLKRGLTTK
ncbi:MAG: hypothetical protein WA208_18520 [Thermoanaerobaculia bacterium]